MGNRKKHHYVPRFYLKRFSYNEDGIFIGIYNYKNNIFIKKAPIKHQAAKNYLYGKDDEVEFQLSKLESSMSKLFYYWTNKKILVPPPEGTNGNKLLKRFILYQLFRTPKAGNSLNDSLSQSFYVIVKKYYPEIWEKIKGGKLVNTEPVLLALLNSMNKEHLLDFLSCKFLVNLSPLPFITSDSPVILYNQLMEKRNQYIGATALVSKGLQVFYPIHPRLMICLYDTKEYTYGDNINCIDTESIEDVHQLNSLQYINSDSQVFFNEVIEQNYVEEIIKGYELKKNNSRKINELLKSTDGRSFLYSSFEDSKINLNLSFSILLNDDLNKSTKFELRHESFNKY